MEPVGHQFEPYRWCDLGCCSQTVMVMLQQTSAFEGIHSESAKIQNKLIKELKTLACMISKVHIIFKTNIVQVAGVLSFFLVSFSETAGFAPWCPSVKQQIGSAVLCVSCAEDILVMFKRHLN